MSLSPEYLICPKVQIRHTLLSAAISDKAEKTIGFSTMYAVFLSQSAYLIFDNPETEIRHTSPLSAKYP